MGISERKEREKQELRDKIINAAMELFLENGQKNTSIRMIANKIEYSPATIYLHFKDKDELFYVIMERAFGKFFEYFSSVLDIKNPLKRLQELGHVYMRFVIENPHSYNLMFVMKEPMKNAHMESKGFDLGKRSHDVLTNTVQECIDHGYFKGYEPMGLSLMIWSTVHGLAILNLKERLSMYPEDKRDELINTALESLNKMMEKA